VRLLSYQFQPEGDYTELVEVGDLHAGSAHFDEKKALKHRSYILESPDRKVLHLGDGIENALRSSPGSSMFKQKMPPSEQRAWLREYYRPVRERVLGVVAGNHEDRSEREADISADELLVNFLDCPWIRWEAVLSITVGDSRRGQNYTIYTRHAISNSSKPHVVLGAMFNKAKTVQGCDVYTFAHNHMYLYESQLALIPDPRHNRVRKKMQHFVMGDSFIDYEESYAEQHGYPIPNPGQFSLRLYRDTHKVEVVRLLYP
jgi:hypothetical protein